LEEASQALKQAVALNPSYRNANLLLAEVLEKLGSYDEAIKYLENYLTKDSKTLETYYRLVHRRTLALFDKYLTVGLTVAPDDPWLNYQQGYAYAKRGQMELARKQLEILSRVDKIRYKKLNLHEINHLQKLKSPYV